MKNLLGGDDTGKQFFRVCPLVAVALVSVKQEVKSNCLIRYISIWHHSWQPKGKAWNRQLPCISSTSNTPSILLSFLWVCFILGNCQTILWFLVLSEEMLLNSFLKTCINHKKCSFDKTEICYSVDFPTVLFSHTSYNYVAGHCFHIRSTQEINRISKSVLQQEEKKHSWTALCCRTDILVWFDV